MCYGKSYKLKLAKIISQVCICAGAKRLNKILSQSPGRQKEEKEKAGEQMKITFISVVAADGSFNINLNVSLEELEDLIDQLIKQKEGMPAK